MLPAVFRHRWLQSEYSEKETVMPDVSGDLNVLSEDPLCAAVYLPNLDVPIVPNERHFIRSHFPTPQIETANWSLPVTGEVTKSLNPFVRRPC